MRAHRFVLALALLWPHMGKASEAEPVAGSSEVTDVSAPPLSLEAYLSEVEKHWPTLQAADLEQRVAEGDVLSAEGGFDVSWKTKGTVRPVGYYESLQVESIFEKPTSLWGASTFAGWRLGSGEFAVYDGKQETLDYGELLAGVSVPLWKNGPIDERRAKLEQAQIGRQLARLSVKEQKIALARAASHSYWEWVAAGRAHAIAARLLKIVKERETGLRERVEQGAVAPIELKDNARAIAQRENQLASAQRSLTQAEIKLSLFLQGSQLLASGAPQRPRHFPEVSEPVGASNGDIRKAQGQRPETEQLALKLKQNQVEARWARNQTAPGVDLRVLGSQDFGPNNAARPDLNDPVLEVSLLVDIPLQRRVMKGRVTKTSARAGQIRLEQTLLARKISAEVQAARAALVAASEGIEAARREVDLTHELEQAERRRFMDGASNLLFVNIREQQTAEAQLRENSALLDFHRATADLKAAQGL